MNYLTQDKMLFFHEDDYGLIELLPIENLDSLKAQLKQFGVAAEKSWAGYGWKEVNVIGEAKVKLSVRDIKLVELLEIMKRYGFTEIQQVTTGGFNISTRENCINTIGFGQKYSAIYFDIEADNVEKIWFTDPEGLDHNQLVNLLHEIGQKWNLLLVDYTQGYIVSLMDKNTIEDYLNE